MLRDLTLESLTPSVHAPLVISEIIILYSKGRLKPPLTPLTDGQWPPTVGLLTVRFLDRPRELPRVDADRGSPTVHERTVATKSS